MNIFPPAEDRAFYQIKQALANQIAPQLQKQPSDLIRLLERPKDESLGHLSLPVFPFCRELKKSPPSLAAEFLGKLQKQPPDFTEEMQAVSGFINFRLRRAFIQEELSKLFARRFGSSAEAETADLSVQSKALTKSKALHWIVDFASPNIAKNMNAGHLRAGAAGQALINTARFFGVKVTAVNHLGDWGTQFGKLLWAYKKWGGGGKAPESLTVDDLAALYTRFHSEETESSRAEAARLFQKLEAGDKDLRSLWKIFAGVSLKNYEFYWKKLNIKHDLVLGESFYRDGAKRLKSLLREKGLLQKSQGAEAVFLDEGEPPCLIEKSDGASTYGARDISAALYRREKLKADVLVYITGTEQKLHFKQVFKVLEKAGFKTPCLHITFGVYRFKGGGKFSSRKGNAVYLKDLLKEAWLRAAKIMENRKAGAESGGGEVEAAESGGGRDADGGGEAAPFMSTAADKERIAEQVGTGALIFNDLMTDRSKDVEFDWNKALDFTGRSGPFVQYTYVRCGSLIRKYKEKRGGPPPDRFSKKNTLSPEEAETAWRLLYFDEAVYQSFVKLKPHLLAAYLLDLAKTFNRFYAEERILDSPKEDVRILLANMTRKALRQGLSLLNTPLPEAM